MTTSQPILENPSPNQDGFRIWGSFGRAATLTSTSALAGLMIDFASLCIAVRILPKSSVGAFVIFLVIARIAQLIADCGVRTALVQSLASASDNHSETFRTSLALQTLTSAVVSMAIWIAGRSFSITLLKIPHYASYLALFVLFQAWHQVLSGTLQGLRLYRAYAIGELSRSITRLTLLYVLLLRCGMGLDGLLIAAVLAPALASAVQLALVPFQIVPFTLNRKRALQLLKLAYPLGAANLIGVVSDRISRIILLGSRGPAAVAMLEIASKAADTSIQCYMGFQSAFFPTIANLLANPDRSRANRALNDTVRLVTVIVVLISLVVTMERDLIVKTLFSIVYLDTSWALALMFSSLAIALTNNLLDTAIIAAGDTKVAFLLGAFQAAVSLGLCLLFIPRFGYLGAVYAYVGCNCAVNPLVVYRLTRLNIRVSVVNYLFPCSILVLADFLSVQHRGAAWLVCALGALSLVAFVGTNTWRSVPLSAMTRLCERMLPAADPLDAAHNTRLDILIVTERYPPYHEGGYEIACKRTVDFLKSRGHAVTVLTSRHAADSRLTHDGVYRLLHRRMPQRKFSIAPRYIVRELVRAVQLRLNEAVSRAVCQLINPDIVFAWQTDGIGLGTVTVLSDQECPIVHRLDDITLALLLERLKHECNPFRKWARYLVYGIREDALKFSHMIAVSSFLEERYVEAGIPRETITVIPNGIPDTWVQPRISGVCQESQVRLLVAGRVCHDKGVHVAVKAVAELRDTELENVTLDIVGPVEASYGRSLEALVAELDLGANVRICRAVPLESMLQLYDSYDIVLVPSLIWEGFGLTIIEAMARGRAVIAVNRGGPVDIIMDRQNGLLVAPDDPSALAEAARLLIRDRGLRTSIQHAAIASVSRRFTMARTGQHLEKYLCDLMKGPAKSGPVEARQFGREGLIDEHAADACVVVDWERVSAD